MDQKIQLIVSRARVTTHHFPHGTPVGSVVWVSRAHARDLLEAGVCRWPDGSTGLEPTPQEPETTSGPVRRKAGWPLDRFSHVLPLWRGETVLCVGGGPSVTPGLLDMARGRCRVIVINDAYLLAPWADVLYFADYQWWCWHTEGIAKKLPGGDFSAAQVRDAFKSFHGQKVTIEETGMRVPDPDIHMLHNDHGTGLSVLPDTIVSAGNGGYQALNLALHTRPRKVLLLGYDMTFPGGRSHWHGGHPVKANEGSYLRYARRFDSIPPALSHFGAVVINCSPGSAIGSFPHSTLERELAEERR